MDPYPELALAAISIIFLILVLYVNNKKKSNSEDDYLLAGRATRLIPLIATLVMTEFNTATLISFSSLGYAFGKSALFMPLVFLIGLLFYTLIASKKWKKFNGISVAHFFAERYGRSLELFVALILFLTMLGFTSAYLKSLTLLFSPLFTIEAKWISLLLLITILFLTARGGLKSIIRLDLISFCLVIVSLPILLYFTYKLPDLTIPHVLKPIMNINHVLPAKFIISLIFITMFSYILAPWYGQKIVSAKNESIAYTATGCAAIIIFILYEIGIYANIILKSKGVILNDNQLGIPYLIYHALPYQLFIIYYIMIFLIAASTMTGLWSAMVTLMVGSILKFKAHNAKNSFYWMIGCGIMSYIVAITYIDNILNKMILFNIPIVAMSFALLAGFYWKRATLLGAWMSILVGTIWGFGCYVVIGESGIYTWSWAMYGIPLIFISGVIFSFLPSRIVMAKFRSLNLGSHALTNSENIS